MDPQSMLLRMMNAWLPLRCNWIMHLPPVWSLISPLAGPNISAGKAVRPEPTLIFYPQTDDESMDERDQH